MSYDAVTEPRKCVSDGAARTKTTVTARVAGDRRGGQYNLYTYETDGIYWLSQERTEQGRYTYNDGICAGRREL